MTPLACVASDVEASRCVFGCRTLCNNQQMHPLQNRVALVTGASRGLGAAIGIEFARAGASVALFGRDTDGLERVRQAASAAGRPVTTHSVDLADADATEAAVTKVISELGPVDVLVNNAAMVPPV